MVTFLSLCQDVRSQAGISGMGPVNVENQVGIMADVVRWVKEAYAEIQSMYENWNYLHNIYTFTLQGGHEAYDPSLLVGSKGNLGVRTLTRDTFIVSAPLATTGKKRLKWIPWSVWQISPEILEGKVGKPEFYTEDPSGSLHFYPSEEAQLDPNDNIDWAISFQGYARPDIMNVSTDIPVIPEQYIETVKLKALTRYAEYYNSPEVMQSASAEFARQIKRMEYSELPRDNLITIPFA